MTKCSCFIETSCTTQETCCGVLHFLFSFQPRKAIITLQHVFQGSGSLCVVKFAWVVNSLPTAKFSAGPGVKTVRPVTAVSCVLHTLQASLSDTLPLNSATTDYATTPYLRASVHRRCQRSLRGSGTQTVSLLNWRRSTYVNITVCQPRVNNQLRLESNDFGFILCWHARCIKEMFENDIIRVVFYKVTAIWAPRKNCQLWLEEGCRKPMLGACVLPCLYIVTP